MKIFLLVIVTMLLSGCATSSYLNKLPDFEFEEFEYHRSGNTTSADIVAKNAVKDGGLLLIEEVVIKEDWGPFFNANIRIKGLSRAIQK